MAIYYPINEIDVRLQPSVERELERSDGDLFVNVQGAPDGWGREGRPVSLGWGVIIRSPISAAYPSDLGAIFAWRDLANAYADQLRETYPGISVAVVSVSDDYGR
jgi:hypothetical protein